ncbi:MAG: PIN domain-containing protein [Oscillospiraceae bacterium]|nr:PIN domain-containing protein [Oscillospiraceae bacterium]
MNLLIDTNVAIDVLLRREPYYKGSARIFLLSEKGYVNTYISASAATDIVYILRRELKSGDAAVKLLAKLLQTAHIASVTERNIREALDLGWNDFEDSVQYTAGKSIPADYIISRNPKDFANSQISVVTPEDFIS